MVPVKQIIKDVQVASRAVWAVYAENDGRVNADTARKAISDGIIVVPDGMDAARFVAQIVSIFNWDK